MLGGINRETSPDSTKISRRFELFLRQYFDGGVEMNFPQDFGAFFFWAFCAVITFLAGLFSFVAHGIREDFKEMTRSLHGVTVSIAHLSTKLESLDARLEKLERLKDD